jgi:hypothetical protein
MNPTRCAPPAPILPIVNFDHTNYIADNLTSADCRTSASTTRPLAPRSKSAQFAKRVRCEAMDRGGRELREAHSAPSMRSCVASGPTDSWRLLPTIHQSRAARNPAQELQRKPFFPAFSMTWPNCARTKTAFGMALAL